MHQVVSRSKVSRTLIIYWSSTCLYSFGQVASLSVMGSSKSMCMTWAVAVSDVVCLKENLFHQLAWIDGDYCLINHTNDKWWIVYDQCEHPLLLRQSLMRHNLSSFCPCQKVPWFTLVSLPSHLKSSESFIGLVWVITEKCHTFSYQPDMVYDTIQSYFFCHIGVRVKRWRWW